jgi:hypothetical protein
MLEDSAQQVACIQLQSAMCGESTKKTNKNRTCAAGADEHLPKVTHGRVCLGLESAIFGTQCRIALPEPLDQRADVRLNNPNTVAPMWLFFNSRVGLGTEPLEVLK